MGLFLASERWVSTAPIAGGLGGRSAQIVKRQPIGVARAEQPDLRFVNAGRTGRRNKVSILLTGAPLRSYRCCLLTVDTETGDKLNVLRT